MLVENWAVAIFEQWCDVTAGLASCRHHNSNLPSTVRVWTCPSHTCLEIIYLLTTFKDNASQVPMLDHQGPRASTSCITTPGPVVYDISNVEIQDDICQVGRFYNNEFLQDSPSSWLCHFGITVDTSAVAPPSFASQIKLKELGSTPAMKLQTATAEPIHVYGFKDVHLLIGTVDFYVRLHLRRQAAYIGTQRHQVVGSDLEHPRPTVIHDHQEW